ncbi:MAG TPA: glycosyltransferase family 4 protein [Terracidiphilus sp.]|jgi:glycosyltransferase involved in cell wall biosynthesis|nr:glycosyltransferase family 4 protein [Terracidiphilus sp.]
MAVCLRDGVQASQASTAKTARRAEPRDRPRIVLGITSAQTCLVLTGRISALRAAGFQVTLVSGPGPLLQATAEREGARAVAVKMARQIAPAQDLMALLRLWWLLCRLRPDIVEFSTPKAGLLGLVAAVLAGVPRRIYLLRGLKLETAAGVKRAILHAAERVTMACAQTVLCNSNSLRAQALALSLAPAAKLHVLGAGSGIGVDLEHFSPGPSPVRASLGIPRKAAVIGFTGRLTRDKGLPELVAAFEEILLARPDAFLLLVGWFDAAEDALDAGLRARVLRHPRIACTGFVTDAAPYYRAMDVFVLPTLREGFPNAVLEASASGLAVVTTLSTGARDAVVPEVTGLLVPPGYPEAIEEAVLRLLWDGALRERMGSAGRAWVARRFAQDDVLSENVAFYDSQVKETAMR